MISFEALIAAFAMGLLGAGHCLGMCGGIAAALSFSVDDQASDWQKSKLLMLYNVGRISSYTMIGVLFGGLIAFLPHSDGLPWLRLFAGALLIATGLYISNLWRGITWLERGGHYLWRYIQPLAQRLMPVKTGGQAVMLGMLWGWLPCGLIYTALAFAMAQGNAVSSGMAMLVFGLGTLPAVLIGGGLAGHLRDFLLSKRVRVGFAIGFIGFGLWTIGFVAYHQFGGHQHPPSTMNDETPAHHHH